MKFQLTAVPLHTVAVVGQYMIAAQLVWSGSMNKIVIPTADINKMSLKLDPKISSFKNSDSPNICSYRRDNT